MKIELEFGEFSEEIETGQIQEVEEDTSNVEEVPEEDVKPENPEIAEDVIAVDSDTLIAFTNKLYSSELIKELPEGIDAETFSEEDFIKVIQHNFEKDLTAKVEAAKTETVSKLFESLSPQVQKLVEYEINGGDNVETLLKTLVHAKEINELDAEDSNDQARIIREYYLSTGETSDEIESRIQDLIEGGLLEKEAKRIKPRLEKKAEEIATKKINDQRELVEYEAQQRKVLESKVTNVIKKGNVNGIPVTQESANFLMQGIVNDDIPITFKGKKINVSLDQALVLHHKYSKEGNIENLMEALLLLQYPDLVRKHYDKKAVTKEADIFKKDHSYSAATKTGKLIDKPTKKSQGFILSRKTQII